MPVLWLWSLCSCHYTPLAYFKCCPGPPWPRRSPEKEPITDSSFLNPCPKSWSAFRILNGMVGVKSLRQLGGLQATLGQDSSFQGGRCYNGEEGWEWDRMGSWQHREQGLLRSPGGERGLVLSLLVSPDLRKCLTYLNECVNK